MKRHLLDLLAVIHRDGGHHTAAVGVDQSTEDAIKRWGELIIKAECYDKLCEQESV